MSEGAHPIFREWRHLLGYTQMQCATKLGYSRSAVQRYDEGRKTPDKRLLLAMTALANGMTPYGQPSEFTAAPQTAHARAA